MCMVSVRANFEKVDIVALLYSKTGFGERFDHTVGQYFPSVLYWTYDVIQQAGFVVTLFNMTVFHATNIHQISLPPKQSFGAIFLVYPRARKCQKMIGFLSIDIDSTHRMSTFLSSE